MKLKKSELADLFGVTVRTISEWQSDADFPRPAQDGNRKIYDATAAVQWWKEREISRLVEGDDGKRLDLNHERARLSHAQANRQELAERRERGEVAEIRLIGECVGDDYARVRARALVLPTKAAPLVAAESDPNRCREILDDLIREMLNELSDPDSMIYRQG